MNDRFKFRVVRGKNPFTPAGNVLYFALGDEVGFGKDDIVEQCTGLKDKNGNLIYEYDYVKINENIYKVFWNKTKISIENILTKDIIDIKEDVLMEIIGNEHETTDFNQI